MVGAISVADGLAVAGGIAVDLLDAVGAGAGTDCVGAAHPVNNRQISIQVKTNFIGHLLSNLV
jgi:hypothetical protein